MHIGLNRGALMTREDLPGSNHFRVSRKQKHHK
jgi:hypothetical protein